MLKKILLLFIVSFISCRQEVKIQDFTGYKNAYVTLFGAAEQVSGSMTLLQYGHDRLLIDCGLFYPENNKEKNYKQRIKTTDKKNEKIPFDAEKIDYLFVTHAHLDHIGRIPLLVKKGFKGKIFMTPGTYLLAKPMLLSAIRYSGNKRNWFFSNNKFKHSTKSKYKRTVTVHWNNCKWQKKIKNKISYKGRFSDLQMKFDKVNFSPCKVCANKELEPIFERVEIIKPETWYSLGIHLRFKFISSEHIPGSSSVLIELQDNFKNKKTFLFSGDIGNRVALLQKKIKPFPKVDYLWIESTYGKEIRKNKGDIYKFQKMIADAVTQKKIVWIPAFALDRTQKVLYLINKGFTNRIIDYVPVYVPSRLANKINNIYLDEFNTRTYNWFKDEIYTQYKFFPHINSSYNNKKYKPPYILISTSGMMDKALSESLLTHLLPNPKTEVYIVGYQDPDTPGGQLLQGKKEILWNDNIIPVKAQVHKFNFFSAHADFLDVLSFLKNQNKEKLTIFLVHGDIQKLYDRKKALKKEGYKNVTIAKSYKKYTFNITN
jgi:metallo-beta-lactamase family protein